MKKMVCSLLVSILLFTLCACTPEAVKPTAPETDPNQLAPAIRAKLKIEIGDHVLFAELADSNGASVLKDNLFYKRLTISVSNYGGFEKVGVLPWYLPSEDTRITAKPGDIMLYNAQSIVMFYGENTWEYTKLGTVINCSADELAEILGGDETEMIISIVTE